MAVVTREPLSAADAARNAYYALFHAAKALIFERTGATPKKHGSVHRAFTEITIADALVDDLLRKFPVKAYDYKRLGDYEIGPASAISATDAQTAIKEAHRFVTIVRSQLP